MRRGHSFRAESVKHLPECIVTTTTCPAHRFNTLTSLITSEIINMTGVKTTIHLIPMMIFDMLMTAQPLAIEDADEQE